MTSCQGIFLIRGKDISVLLLESTTSHTDVCPLQLLALRIQFAVYNGRTCLSSQCPRPHVDLVRDVDPGRLIVRAPVIFFLTVLEGIILSLSKNGKLLFKH